MLPYLGDDRRTGQRASRVAHQILEQRKLAWAECQRPTIAPHLAREWIEENVADLELGGARS